LQLKYPTFQLPTEPGEGTGEASWDERKVAMASIFTRGKKKVWWIKYYVNGRQVYHSLNTRDARTAGQIRRKIEGEEATGVLVAPSKIPLTRFLEEYCQFLSTIRTNKSYKNDRSILRVLFGPVCPSLAPGSCVNRRWESAPRKPVTLNPMAVVSRKLRTFFRELFHRSLSPTTPAHGLGTVYVKPCIVISQW
jgi:hypothetical protein